MFLLVKLLNDTFFELVSVYTPLECTPLHCIRKSVSLALLYSPLLVTYVLNKLNVGFIKPTTLLSWSVGAIQPACLEDYKRAELEVTL